MPFSSRPGTEVASDRRTDGQHDGVVAFAKFITGDRNSDLDAAPVCLVLHLPDPAIQDGLLHLELRNAVPQQAPRLVGAFVNGDRVSGPAQLLGCRQAAGPEPMTATVFPVCHSGGCGVTRRSSQALSMIATSTFLMVTGSRLMPTTHAVSRVPGTTAR